MSEWQDAWSKAVEAAKADLRYPRHDLLALIASGPDDREDVLAARRLLQKERYGGAPQ